jgi:hypothetical protein
VLWIWNACRSSSIGYAGGVGLAAVKHGTPHSSNNVLKWLPFSTPAAAQLSIGCAQVLEHTPQLAATGLHCNRLSPQISAPQSRNRSHFIMRPRCVQYPVPSIAERLT